MWRAFLVSAAACTAILFWPSSTVAESPPASVEEAALALAKQAESAYGQRLFPEAERCWRLICIEHSTTRQYGAAQYNLGVVLRHQKKYDEAIAEFMKLLPSEVNDREPGCDVMEFFRNYRNSAAKQISLCYELKGDLQQALDGLIQARDTYRYQSRCCTCMASEASQIAIRAAQLTWKIGRNDEAAMLTEELVLGERGTIVPFEMVQRLAEHHFAQGSSSALLERVEQFRQRRFEESRNYHWNESTDRPFDGHTDATLLILEYLEVLKLAVRNDQNGLWNLIQQSKTTALDAMFPFTARETAVGLAARHLVIDREVALPFLKEKYKRRGVEKAWAIVLLAKLGEVKNVEALHRLAIDITIDSNTEAARRRAAICRQDYLLAVLFAAPDSRRWLTGRYSNTRLAKAAEAVIGRSAEIPSTEE